MRVRDFNYPGAGSGSGPLKQVQNSSESAASMVFHPASVRSS